MHKLDLESVSRAFSRQSGHFDEEDLDNPILQELRKQVYRHVEKFIRPESKILELNAGTGIDAEYFITKGHSVHAIDIADGMVEEHRKKVALHDLNGRWKVEKLSVTELHRLESREYDYLFSNFGGLNCIRDVKEITIEFPRLLKKRGFVTLVIMPPFHLWELFGALKGNRGAFRRLKKSGVMAQLGGEHFRTWYHSLSSISVALGKDFKLITSEGLAAVSPPPHAKQFAFRHPTIYRSLRAADVILSKHFPFNRWADHVIMTFQYKS